MHDLWGVNFLLYWYVPDIFGRIDISISYLLNNPALTENKVSGCNYN